MSGEAQQAGSDAEQHTEQRVVEAELGEMTELESLCPKCEHNGVTRLMITKIPHFREVIVSSFECPHCGERNNEIQFGGQFGEYHTRHELSVTDSADLNRQVVKSEYATIIIPELELEIPPASQKGTLNTVEGVLMVTQDGLQQDQPVRKIMHPELAEKIDQFCEKLEAFRSGKVPFTLILDDPAGNSYIEPLFSHFHPTIDPKIKKSFEKRTDIERQLLGLAVEYNTQHRTEHQEQMVEQGELEAEIAEMEQPCPACAREGMLRAHKVDIPYFKETLIMCFKCDSCGFKSTEVKNGGGVAPKGRRIVLTVEKESDLKRDVLKSDTTHLEIPEIELELTAGTLGGFFTSVEGLLNQVYESLSGLTEVAFEQGDSIKFDTKRRGEAGMKGFLAELAELRDGKRLPFTVILDDPLANVYVQNPRAHLPPPENEDPQLHIEDYERTPEQDEEYGLNALRKLEEASHEHEVAASGPGATPG